MSLSYSDIASILAEGISFHLNDKEHFARADMKSDNVIIREMTSLASVTIPLETIVDRCEANESGSELTDRTALRQLLAELVR